MKPARVVIMPAPVFPIEEEDFPSIAEARARVEELCDYFKGKGYEVGARGRDEYDYSLDGVTFGWVYCVEKPDWELVIDGEAVP